jgi:hypothetical protein
VGRWLRSTDEPCHDLEGVGGRLTAATRAEAERLRQVDGRRSAGAAGTTGTGSAFGFESSDQLQAGAGAGRRRRSWPVLAPRGEGLVKGPSLLGFLHVWDVGNVRPS